LSQTELNRISKKIIGCVYEVGKILKYGYLEKVYENALVYELNKAGLKVKQQQPVTVKYKEIEVGSYIADLLVEESVLVELKSVKTIDNAHIAQCLNYLKTTGLKLGLVVNFGESKIEIKRLVKGFE